MWEQSFTGKSPQRTIGGLVTGAVSDANTTLPLAGVTVRSGAASTVSGSAGIYVLFLPSGTQDVTATGIYGYGDVTASVSVSTLFPDT